MEWALYHQELGYYAREARKTGRAGDFFTSVDVGPIFGELLARQFAEMWRLLDVERVSRLDRDRETRPAAFDLVEAGAGNGRLSRDILDAAYRDDRAFYSAIRLSLIERSPAARAAQAAALGPHLALLEHSVSSLADLSALPDQLQGVIFANELLDALPTHAVAMSDEGLREVFVDYRDGKFVELLAIRRRQGLRSIWRAPVRSWRQAGARRSISPRRIGSRPPRTSSSGDFFSSLITATKKRSCTARHIPRARSRCSSGTPPKADLQEPGSCDITAHVDLSAVRRAAEQKGMNLLARLDQTYFMMGLGLDDLMNSPQGFDSASLHRRLALKTLMLPGGLGSTHKVLVFGKGVGAPRASLCRVSRETDVGRYLQVMHICANLQSQSVSASAWPFWPSPRRRCSRTSTVLVLAHAHRVDRLHPLRRRIHFFQARIVVAHNESARVCLSRVCIRPVVGGLRGLQPSHSQLALHQPAADPGCS